MNFIERLESRIAPAILIPSVVKGVLQIEHDAASGTAETLLVQQVTPDSFSVTDTVGPTNFGTFTGIESIEIAFDSQNSGAELRFSSDGLPGSLEIAVAGGNNTFLLTSTGPGGQIAGKVKIIGGAGSDSVTISGGLSLKGAVAFEGGAGTDSFEPTHAFFPGKTTLESIESITVPNTFGPVTFGSLLVENEGADGAVVFVLSNVAAVTGSLTYCGSDSVPDSVTIDGQVHKNAKLMLLDGANNVSAAGTFLGGLTLTGGTGDDTVLFHSVSLNLNPALPPFITASVMGSLSMNLGNGTNDVTFQDGAVFGKGVKLTAGTGTDTVQMDGVYSGKEIALALGNGVNTVTSSPGSNQSNFVAGTFKYTGGADADSLDIDAMIASKISASLGNGANAVTGSAQVFGKSASFKSGTGSDSFAFSLGSAGASLEVKMGGGVDTFAWGGGSLAAVKADGGLDADTLTGLGLFPVKRTVKGFETAS
jgi:hypothetical protein